MLPVFKLRYCKIIPDIHLLVKARMIATTSLTYTGQPNSIVMEDLFSFREDTINPLHQLRATPLVMYKVIIISHLSIAFLSWKNIIIPIKLSLSVMYPSYKKVPPAPPISLSKPDLSHGHTFKPVTWKVNNNNIWLWKKIGRASCRERVLVAV